MIRVLVIDDQELVRAGLRHVLRASAGFEVVGEATDGRAALDWLSTHNSVDAVLMDVRMRGMDGISATTAISQMADAPPVLVLTTFGEDDVLAGALRAGASGFILKDAPGEELQRAVRAVAAGDGWLDPAVTGRVLATFRRTPEEIRDAAASDTDLADLTPREIDVLRLVGRGRSNTEIADDLVISEATVKTHLSHVFDKLGVRDRAAAIVWAFDAGIVHPQT